MIFPSLETKKLKEWAIYLDGKILLNFIVLLQIYTVNLLKMSYNTLQKNNPFSILDSDNLSHSYLNFACISFSFWKITIEESFLNGDFLTSFNCRFYNIIYVSSLILKKLKIVFCNLFNNWKWENNFTKGEPVLIQIKRMFLIVNSILSFHITDIKKIGEPVLIQIKRIFLFYYISYIILVNI